MTRCPFRGRIRKPGVRLGAQQPVALMTRSARKTLPIGQFQRAVIADAPHRDPPLQLRTQFHSAVGQILGDARWIDDEIFGHQQSARQPATQCRLFLSEFCGRENLAADADLLQHGMLALDRGHLLLIGRDPECPAHIRFGVGWQLRQQLVPQLARRSGQGQLRG